MTEGAGRAHRFSGRISVPDRQQKRATMRASSGRAHQMNHLRFVVLSFPSRFD